MTGLTRSEARVVEELMSQAALCREKANDATHKGSAVGTREWLEAAEVAVRTANHIKAAAREAAKP